MPARHALPSPPSTAPAPRRRVSSARTAVKRGMAEMLKGGVIMDVVDAEQARIAEEAGAVAVMALERVPADIRRDGGVARMSDPDMIDGIQAAVSIPVMAKARIGHFVEAQVLQAIGVDYVDESEVLTPADYAHHIDKRAFTVPVRLRRHQPGRGAAPHRRGRGDDPLQGRGRHRRRLARRPRTSARSCGEIKRLTVMDESRAVRGRQGACARRSSWSARPPSSAGCPSCCSPPAASRPPPTRR